MQTHPTSNASCLARVNSRIMRRRRAGGVLPPLRSTLLSTALVLAVSAIANARPETLRWEHSDPDQVVGYRVHYGLNSGIYTTHIDVELPAANADGTYSYDMEVPDEAEVYVAVTAYDAQDQESDYSNEQLRAPEQSGGDIEPPSEEPKPLGQPGRPELVP